MGLRDATIDRERRDLATRQVMDESRLIRFVAAPDGSVAPDLGRKLPGRGMWVEATRAAVDEAVKRNLFARAAKAQLKPASDLSDLIEGLLARRCLDQLGLARREGVLVSGFEKAAAAIRAGRAAWLVEAADGAADGRGKLLALARHQTTRICGTFGVDDLSLALGLENAIHAVLLEGGRADRWTLEVERLAGFRPLRPPEWDRTGSGDPDQASAGGS
jgi:predicted RNA-binding protein YlxR (DUF448 family)